MQIHIGFSQCICDNLADVEISCDPTIFTNGAKIYRQFNCDSSWMVFESKDQVKKILHSQYGGDPEFAERIGFVSHSEHKNTFLMMESAILGCCDPRVCFMFDKESGKQLMEIGPLIFESNDDNYPFVASIDESSDALDFVNYDTRKTFKVPLPKGRIEKTMSQHIDLFPEELFGTETIKNGILTIAYIYRINDKEGEEKEAKVFIDLKKHLR